MSSGKMALSLCPAYLTRRQHVHLGRRGACLVACHSNWRKQKVERGYYFRFVWERYRGQTGFVHLS